jgi:glycosyltransferase involved in cell wall biosynthesis
MPKTHNWIDPYGVPVRIFGIHWPERWRDHAFAFGVCWHLFRHRKQYQVVYFLMQGLHLAAALPVARLLNKPVIMKFSGSGLISNLQLSWLGRLELHWLRKWASRVMILNPGMAQEALRAGFIPAQLLWMPNPVDVGQFAPLPVGERLALRANLGLPPGVQIIVYAGRLAPEKELPVLLRSFARITTELPQTLMVFVGDGPERDSLCELARGLGLNAKVRFLGRVPADVVAQWLQAADVFTLVSSNEGFPCALVEAMSVALPSVVSNIPGNTQLIEHEVHGLVTPLGDETAIAAALARLLKDESLRLRLGNAARTSVLASYSTHAVISRYEALLNAVVDAYRRLPLVQNP